VKSTVENLSPTRVRLAVEVPFDDLKPSLDKAYKQLAQQIRVPGFRPGKVPARVIDQRVGRGAVLQEAVNDALPQLYGEAAREHELRPLGQPDIDITQLDDGTSLSFTAEVDVRPEITLPELEGIAVTVDDAVVADDDVEVQLNDLRDRFGTLKGVERPVQVGDYVSIDLVAKVGDGEVEGGSAKGLSYVVGSDDLVDGLDEAITGKSAGDSATFPTTLRQGDHAGQEGEVTVTVKSVKVKELPEVDDEFAQLASEFDTVDELRNDLRERLARVKTLEQGAQARDKVLEHLIDSVDFPLPESAVKAEIDFREHEVVHTLNHDDALFERYLEAQGKTREEFENELRESAEKSVRAQFVLDAVADRIDAQPNESELTEYLIRQAQRYQMAPQEFANQIVQAGNLPVLMADLRRNKALAQLLETAVVTDGSGNPVDLAALTAADLEAADEDYDGDLDADFDSDLDDGHDTGRDSDREHDES
jgi:trigger factor